MKYIRISKLARTPINTVTAIVKNNKIEIRNGKM